MRLPWPSSNLKEIYPAQISYTVLKSANAIRQEQSESLLTNSDILNGRFEQQVILVAARNPAAADLVVDNRMYTLRARARVVIALFVADWLAVAISQGKNRRCGC